MEKCSNCRPSCPHGVNQQEQLHHHGALQPQGVLREVGEAQEPPIHGLYILENLIIFHKLLKSAISRPKFILWCDARHQEVQRVRHELAERHRADWIGLINTVIELVHSVAARGRHVDAHLHFINIFVNSYHVSFQTP